MLKKLAFSPDIDIEKIITFTAGLSGADLKKIERESILQRFREKREYINEEMLIEQINILRHGHIIKDIDLTTELEMTSYHEAGHAVLGTLLLPHRQIEQVTVSPRKKSLGFVSFVNEANSYSNLSKEQIQNEMSVLLAGRVAQSKKFEQSGIDSGASSDLAKATQLAYWAITELGMSESLRDLNLYNLSQKKGVLLFEAEIQDELKEWIKRAKERAKTMVEQNWQSIENVAKILIEDEVIDFKSLKRILSD
jgi:cell division protease FtsH